MEAKTESARRCSMRRSMAGGSNNCKPAHWPCSLFRVTGRPLFGCHQRRFLDLFDPCRAVLELGDLAKRVERRVGQEVRRRLDIGEGNEHDAVGHPIVLARGEFDRAAARRDTYEVARLDAELCDLMARKGCDGSWFQRVERGRAPGHRAGMPMLELPAGGEHEREFRI